MSEVFESRRPRGARLWATAALAAGAALGGAGLGLAGCGSAQHPASVVTLPALPSAPPTAPPTVPPTTRTSPTTAYAPSAPQPSPDAAASVLVAAWAAANRTTAASVASPQSVATLFAVTYPGSSLAIPRGCSAAFPPIVCTYGPAGGAAPSDRLFEMVVARAAAGWYVSSVRILG